MKVWFKRNKRLACYDSKQLETVQREWPEPLSGPFDECKDCPYCGHGFVCWCAGGPCLREALRKVNRRKEKAKCPM